MIPARQRARLFLAPAYALVLALLATAPLLAPGYLLLRDAVSTPRSYLSDSALGLSEAAPRALPQDFAVALATALVDGGEVVKVLLVTGLFLAGWGAARLAAMVVPEAGLAGQFVAVTIAVWNPYVAERLLQGHWSLIVGYGCLPWVATAMLQLRTSGASQWAGVCALVFWIALAGLTPTGLMLAATVAVTCIFAPGSGRPRWWCAAVGLGAAVLVALPWLAAAAVAVVVPAAMATGPGMAAVEATIRTLPGLGVVRDAQKWVALAVPVYSLAGAAAVVTVRNRIPAAATALICCAALIATLPDLAWGVGGKMSAVQYPPGWARAAAMINADPRPVAVLPADSMRRFAWAGDTPVLDPLPRWVRADVLTTGDLTIGGRTVPGEGDRARDVQQLLLTGADRDKLAAAGVGWVVVENIWNTGWSAPALRLPVAYQDEDVTLYRVGDDHPAASGRGIMLAAHWLWLGVLMLGGLLAGLLTAWRRRVSIRP